MLKIMSYGNVCIGETLLFDQCIYTYNGAVGFFPLLSNELHDKSKLYSSD